MKGKIIVIEGLDGAGKTTQKELLIKYFDKLNILYKDIHFPMLNKGIYGTLIAEFLRGEFGGVNDVHPKLVALLFANDRKEHIEEIVQLLQEGYIILADRYVNSNIAFQCAKCSNAENKDLLKNWILKFEFQTNKLPLPDISFFLDVPLSAIKLSLKNERIGEERQYLNGKKDIHENSMDLQKRVYEEYIVMTKEQKNFQLINCYGKENNFLKPSVISEKIIRYLIQENIVQNGNTKVFI